MKFFKCQKIWSFSETVEKFNESIITNSAADFACLHSANDELEEGTTCYTAGWGWNKHFDWRPDGYYNPLFEVCVFCQI